MNIFGIGLPEMAVIVIVALLIFGPKKLPEIGRSVAKTIKAFQNASKEFEEEFKREAEQLERTTQTKPLPPLAAKETPEAEPETVVTATPETTSEPIHNPQQG